MIAAKESGLSKRTPKAQPVPLAVAAAMVHQQVLGMSALAPDTDLKPMLDRCALALSQVCAIYSVDARGRLRRIPAEELALGVFEDGAQLYRTRSGNTYESLSVRRGDLLDAIVGMKTRG
jgi:hypothetical protein